ncbi:MAG TPA: phosphoribosyltransferase family protein [Conexibacter sp.]|nr:phosphoribosyltransferase family protein [Conexibacter sp.]
MRRKRPCELSASVSAISEEHRATILSAHRSTVIRRSKQSRSAVIRNFAVLTGRSGAARCGEPVEQRSLSTRSTARPRRWRAHDQGSRAWLCRGSSLARRSTDRPVRLCGCSDAAPSVASRLNLDSERRRPMQSETTTRVFEDRRDAGRQLGERAAPLAREHPVVVGLPRGGVPVAFEVARTLDAPLDVLVARKIGAPANPEFGIGAVAEGGVRVLNDWALRSLALSSDEIDHASARAERELVQRVGRYRGGHPPIDVHDRTVVLVDDGLATGGTARAALRALRARGPARLVLAVPVGARETLDDLRAECDEIVCLQAPEPMWAVGYWYRDFGQTTDAEVRALLSQATWRPAARSAPAPTGDDPPLRRHVRIPLPGNKEIVGDLTVPETASGIVVFAHGSGSSRHSPRNRAVAGALASAGFGTLLIDLLTNDEERWRMNVFDIGLLVQRLAAATDWVGAQAELSRLALGYFGASTGAAAALAAAADRGDQVRAVVSRGGRPDLAGPRLRDVRAPTLLIVGGEDDVVIQLNRDALAQLRCEAHLEIIPGATHLFEEPGALEHVARLAVAWFARHLTAPSTAT